MAKVYLSSTLLDLQRERHWVTDWLVANRHVVIQSYSANSETVRDSCLADVDESDLYLLILGRRYGQAPAADNPDKLSITHMEYRRAGARGIPRLVFDSVNVNVKAAELGNIAQQKRMNKFRGEIGERMAEFGNQAELTSALSVAVPRELARLEAKATALAAVAPRPKPEPAAVAAPTVVLKVQSHKIVARASLLDVIRQKLAAGARLFAFRHLAGVGKTTLAAELVRRSQASGSFPDGVLWANIGPDPDVSKQLRKWATALGSPTDASSTGETVGDLYDRVAAAIGRRRLLLVIDDVWSSDAGQYFKFFETECVHVFTTRDAAVAAELVGKANVYEVERFSADDGVAFLASFLDDPQHADTASLRALTERVGGLPIALVLLGSLLRVADDDNEGIQSVMNALPRMYEIKKELENTEQVNLTLSEVIDVSYKMLGRSGPLNRQSLDGDVLREALKAYSIFRPDPAYFSPAVAALVSDADPQALRDLANAGLIDKVEEKGDATPGAAPQPDVAKAPASKFEPRYTMHRLIAEYVRGKLSDEQRRALNLRVVHYYADRLSDLEAAYQAESVGTYAGMYRYEDPEWVDAQDNWLYYLAETGDQREGVLAFLTAWFDGFWWWGCFQEFGFCNQLLQEWEQRKLPQGAEDGLAHLARFKNAYPKETEARDGGDWTAVAEVLNEVRRRTRIDADLAQLTSPDARHVRALTDIFLAEAARFGAGDLVTAERWYREALSIFEETPAHWNTPWMMYHLADMFAAAGRVDDAEPLCRDALPLGMAQRDYEIVANLHRVLGDIAVQRGRIAEAGEPYRQAVDFAYRFQVEPSDPDSYTVDFFPQVAHQVAAGLMRAQATDRAAVRELALALRAHWQALGAMPPQPLDGALPPTTQALAAQLFPAPLDANRLAVDGAAYAALVRRVVEAMNAASPS